MVYFLSNGNNDTSNMQDKKYGGKTMSEFNEKAKELRKGEVERYNCAQAVLMPFAEKAGISEEQAFAIAANFGGGMKRGATCGAITSGLMVLGLFGVNDATTIREYHRQLKENHQGHLECAELLRINKEQGKEKKPHCDSMIQEVISLVENILKEKGVILA